VEGETRTLRANWEQLIFSFLFFLSSMIPITIPIERKLKSPTGFAFSFLVNFPRNFGLPRLLFTFADAIGPCKSGEGCGGRTKKSSGKNEKLRKQSRRKKGFAKNVKLMKREEIGIFRDHPGARAAKSGGAERQRR
jgi:hypothetical protein